MDGIPNTPQDLLKQLEKELENLWDNLASAESEFEYHDKEVKHYKGIVNSVTKQIEDKEQYIKKVATWKEK